MSTDCEDNPLSLALLHDAIHKRSAADVQHIVEVNPQILNARDIGGWTALHIVASYGSSAIMAILLRWGASVHARDNLQDTPLHLVAESVRETTDSEAGQKIQQLLNAGADIHAQNRDGDTPLHLAVATATIAATNSLLSAHANSRALNFTSRSPLHRLPLAESKLRTVFKRQSRQRTKDRISRILDVLLSAGADINAPDVNGFTALHVAIAERSVITAQELLAAGASPLSRALDGRTPLHLAVEVSRIDICTLLLEKSPEAMLELDEHGHSSFFYVIGVKSPDILNQLLQLKPDSQVRDPFILVFACL